ncbi:Cupredoxin [Cucurbitaria berberidis CBS 394.84]|uniref:Cupredoxin n=1 Tax=Cucurbitaria berberidis CBS 394.84 TaxID=1168544 RepID=A0A9P4GFL8_9PLEO|nr:Cupredoxin [Cucurbitaria berberidis CBS 394.84]KAF1844285.1 Cupredoxin [Cucurbitaria berberidis CBS 394.84]
MYFSRSVIVSALLGFAAATKHSQSIAASEALLASSTRSSSGSMSTGSRPSNSAAGMVNTHIIQVGGPNGSLAFYPNSIKAAPGDLVQFQFHPKNHSVVQSTFDNPCVPIQNIQANKTDAFFSGFMPSNASTAAASKALTYTIRVTDTKPVWFYCSQGKHCQAGMVGAINAPASGNRTMQAFIGLAAAAKDNLSPGQAAGSSSGGNTPPSPSSGSGASPGNADTSGSAGAGGAGAGAGAASSTGASPAQQTTNAAPGLSSQSFLGLGVAVAAAFVML